MVIDLLQNFVSTQYVENKMTEFHQMLKYALILTRSELGLLHVIVCTFMPSYGPWFTLEISLHENKLTEF